MNIQCDFCGRLLRDQNMEPPMPGDLHFCSTGCKEAHATECAVYEQPIFPSLGLGDLPLFGSPPYTGGLEFALKGV